MNFNELQSGQILSGSASLAPGRSTTITTESMASRSLKWLRVEEMTVQLWPNKAVALAPPAGDALNQQSMGSFLTVRPTAYRVSLTNDFTPLWLLGPRSSVQAEKVPQPTDLFSGAETFGAFESYRWKFAKPFYMPPGAAFLVQAQRNGNALDLAFTPSINIRVIVRCTQISEKGARAAMLKNGGNPLPYASSFVPASYPAQSADLTFKNQFQTTLFIQRMTGRCAGYSSLMAFAQNQGGIDYTNAAQVQLWDTRTLLSEKVPFHTLFPRTSLAWTFTRSLKPTEYLTARLYTSNSAVCAPQVGMVGYRNEEIP